MLHEKIGGPEQTIQRKLRILSVEKDNKLQEIRPEMTAVEDRKYL